MRSLCLLSTLLGFALAFQFDSKVLWICSVLLVFQLIEVIIYFSIVIFARLQEKAQGLGLNCGCQCSSPVLTFQVCDAVIIPGLVTL